MNLSDLTAELEAKADEVTPSLGVTRLAAVRGRARARRRRQAGAAALLAVGCALAIVVVPTLLDLTSSGSTGPSKHGHQQSGDPQPAPFTFDRDLAGDPLIASAVGKAGQNVLVLRFTPKDNNLSMSSFCYLHSGTLPLMDDVTVNGRPFVSTSCEYAKSGSPSSVSAGDGSARSNRAAWAEMGVVPGRESVIQLRMQTQKGQLPARPSVQLGLGLYEESGQRVVENGVTIKRDAENDGHDYRLAVFKTIRVTAGHKRLSVQVPAQAHPGYLTFGQSDGSGDLLAHSSVELNTDGKAAEENVGGGIASFPATDARAHTFEVQTNVTGGTLIFAFYQRVD